MTGHLPLATAVQLEMRGTEQGRGDRAEEEEEGGRGRREEGGGELQEARSAAHRIFAPRYFTRPHQPACSALLCSAWALTHSLMSSLSVSVWVSERERERERR